MPSGTAPARPRFAVGNAMFGEIAPEHLALVAEAGFPGIEIYRSLLAPYLDRPRELKELADRHGLTVCTFSNGGRGQTTDFINPERRQQTIDDHIAFARDVLVPFGCTYFKMNLGGRPRAGTTEADIAAIADTLNVLGRATATLGIRTAAHPHIWGPIERPEEVRRMLALTDPASVSWIPDTGQLNLGGGDPYALIVDYYDRIAGIHWKDTKPSYRGYTGPTPTHDDHRRENVYKDLGTGGVDLPRIWQFLLSRGYAGWITLDLDPPRPTEGEGTAAEKLEINRRYLLDQLRVGTLG